MKPVLVGEIGLNHNGSVELAKKLIDLAKANNIDYVKFQKRTIDAVYSKEDLAKPKKTSFGKTYGDEKRGLEFGEKEYEEISKYCKEVGIGWFASVWDVDSVDFMAKFETPFLKLASCCCNHMELLRKVQDSGCPSILSVGMSNPREIEEAVTILYPRLEYILSTTSVYPCPDGMVNLQKIRAIKDAYGRWGKIGFSSHSEKIIFPVVASLFGAEMVEFHVTLDHDMEGPDHKSSVGPVGMKRISDHIAAIERGWGGGSLFPFPEEMVKGRKYAWRRDH